MADIDVPNISADAFQSGLAGFAEFARRYRADEGFRQQVDRDPAASLREHGLDIPPAIGVQVHANDATTFHVVFPPDPNVELSDESLEAISGGSTIGCAGSVATASSLVCACAPSSVSSLSSAGTASSI